MTDIIQYNPALHHRRSIRLQGYNYSQAGAYFITICTQNRGCLFGEIVAGKMNMNDAGLMVQTVWDGIPIRFDGMELDRFVVMPNHIHGIIVLPRMGESGIPPFPIPPNSHSTGHKEGDQKKGNHKGRPHGTLPGTLARIMQAFKSITTNEYTNGVKLHGWQPFSGKLWQRNYWEHIIRKETELNRIREYTHNNPDQWESDTLYCRPDGRLNEICEPVIGYELEDWMI